MFHESLERNEIRNILLDFLETSSSSPQVACEDLKRDGYLCLFSSQCKISKCKSEETLDIRSGKYHWQSFPNVYIGVTTTCLQRIMTVFIIRPIYNKKAIEQLHN